MAEQGIIPILQTLISSSKAIILKEKAVLIFISLFTSSEKTRELLWKHNAASTVFDLLASDLWFVEGMETLEKWATTDSERLGKYLNSIQNTEEISPLICIFSESRTNKYTFSKALSPLLNVLTRFTSLNNAFADRGVISQILALLLKKHIGEKTAVSRLLLLKILNAILTHCSNVSSYFADPAFQRTIKRLTKKSSLGVIEKELILNILTLDAESALSQQFKDLKIQIEESQTIPSPHPESNLKILQRTQSEIHPPSVPNNQYSMARLDNFKKSQKDFNHKLRSTLNNFEEKKEKREKKEKKKERKEKKEMSQKRKSLR